jgi:hypothetical protein
MPAVQKPQIGQKKWITAIEQLMAAIEKWSIAMGWFVERKEKLIQEKRYGSYAVPALFIRTNQGKIVVDPIALDILDGDGRIDIEAFPSLHRFVLIRKNDNWILLTDAYIPWSRSWSKKAFYEIIEALDAA